MLNKLNDREKMFVIGGIGALILVLFGTLFLRLKQFRDDLTDRLVEGRSNFSKMDRLINEYNYYRGIKSGNEENVNEIYAKLDPILVRYNLKERVATQRDTPTDIKKDYNKITIDISFKSVTLPDIFKMIYDIEVNKQINSKVDYINFIKPLPGKEVYDVTVRFSSFSRKKK